MNTQSQSDFLHQSSSCRVTSVGPQRLESHFSAVYVWIVLHNHKNTEMHDKSTRMMLGS